MPKHFSAAGCRNPSHQGVAVSTGLDMNQAPPIRLGVAGDASVLPSSATIKSPLILCPLNTRSIFSRRIGRQCSSFR
jgi:hypothetical protein